MSDKLLAFLKKALVIMLTLITPILSCSMSFEPLAKYDKECIAAQEKIGGFMQGVCHARGDYEMMKDAGITWTRKDIPFPFDKQGNLTPSYISWRAEMKEYADNGIRIFAITPYPEDYIEAGIDPRDDASKQRIQEIAQFFCEDLRGIAGAIQVTNEMGIDRFTYPLTLDEAAYFIGIQLEAMQQVKGDIIVGYNLGGLSIVTLPMKMLKWNKYCDYVGVDLYLGSFEDIAKEIDQYLAIIGFVRKITGKPIIMCEFGYIGNGKQKTEDEKVAILQKYGYSSEAEAIADMDNFIEKLPPDMRDELKEIYPGYTAQQYGDLLFTGEYKSHFYCALPDGFYLNGYDHTPEGQAKFYSDILPKMMALDYVIGAVIYCWEDSDECYVCGQAECPVETGWGLVDLNGKPKPAYYAVKDIFTAS